MARVRLFASVAEVAGVRELDVDGVRVADVLGALEERFGPAFAEQIPHCTVWVDGDKASGDTAVGPASEVALLPPVSGGQR